MLDELVDGDASCRVWVEESGDEAACVGGEPVGDLELAIGDLLVHLHEVGIEEREVAGEEEEEDDAAGPDVGGGPVVALVADDLRRDVRRRAARRVEEAVVPPRRAERAEPEVGDLEVAAAAAAVVVDEEVLRLEVAVVDAAAVAEVDGGDELVEVPPRRVLPEAAAAGDQPGEELAAADELHDEVDLAPAGHHLVEADHVGVAADEPHDGDLALDLVDHAGAGAQRLLLVDHLHGDGLAGHEAPGLVHLGERAVPQRAAELVPAHHHGALLRHLDTGARRRRHRQLVEATAGLVYVHGGHG